MDELKINERIIPRKFNSKEEMIKEIQRILLYNDYGIHVKTTRYKKKIITSIEWLKN